LKKMPKIAFLFPGQGSQSVGMGVAVAEAYPSVRPVFDEASQILGFDLLQVCREGPEDKLKQTEIAQPALYVTGYAAFKVLESLGIEPAAVAGHSIGEYAALAAANVFSFAEGIRLVRERARLMRDAGKANPGSMAAIIGLDSAQVEAACQEASSKGVCAAVNYNSPEQTVIAGDVPALEEAGRLATAKGAKRVIPLNVSGAFHSPLMKDAADAMRQILTESAFKNARVPVVMNLDGKPHLNGEDIRRTVSSQLDHAVRWVQTVQTLKAEGMDTFIECGAGRVLTGLLRRIDRQLQAFATDSPDAIKEAAEA
jgi:[acyl-carrier-protein] S-malonyltransferase